MAMSAIGRDAGAAAWEVTRGGKGLVRGAVVEYCLVLGRCPEATA
jgi:hypothetical protein